MSVAIFADLFNQNLFLNTKQNKVLTQETDLRNCQALKETEKMSENWGCSKQKRLAKK